VVVIAAIYFQETFKQKQLQRKQTVNSDHPDSDIIDLKIPPSLDIDDERTEHSETISELSKSVVNSKEDDIDSEDTALLIGTKSINGGMPSDTLSETQDLFKDSEQDKQLQDEQIIALYITALSAQIFKGNDILDAVNNVGMEYGEMNIFHPYGIEDMQSDKPLFICLTSSMDGQVVFELMLNTAQRLSELLEGELRGTDHNLSNDQPITKMCQSIIQQAQRKSSMLDIKGPHA